MSRSIAASKITAVVLISSYVILRMIADSFFWRNISEYYGYAFEVLFCGVAWWIYRKQITLYKKPNKKDYRAFSIAVALGMLTFLAAGWMKISNPFDFDTAETVFLLLILAPLLEEAIFRMALWQALNSLTKDGWIILIATTVLFSIGHFVAYWFVPAEFHSFVLYQTVYVVGLGLAAGWRRLKTNSISSGLWVHFGFNLGFYLATHVH